MKKFYFLCSLLVISVYTWANMASPMRLGTATGLPYVSTYLSVRHERILIVPASDFKTCRFEVVYDIFADSAGIRIPMLFVASGYEDGMKITVDGTEVKSGKLPSAAYLTKTSPLSHFPGVPMDEMGAVQITWENGSKQGYLLQDLHYFEFDMSPGAHQIQVEYVAKQWRDRRQDVAKEFFLYALSPAKNWSSFGKLDITLDASASPYPLTTNLGPPTSGDLKTKAIWNLDRLPDVPTMEIVAVPEITAFARFLIKFGTEGFLWLGSIVLTLTHLTVNWRWRRKNPGRKFSWIWLVGSVFVPFFAMLIFVMSGSLIDGAIGPAAAHYRGYELFIFVFYPIVLLAYAAVTLIIDFLIRRAYRRSA